MTGPQQTDKQALRQALHNTFFDIHCHLYNLSHAGLLAYLSRIFKNNSIAMQDLLKTRIWRIYWNLFNSRNKLVKFLLKLLALLLIPLLFSAGWLLACYVVYPLLTTWLMLPHPLEVFLAGLGAVLLLLGCFTFIIKLGRRKQLKIFFNIFSYMENDICSMLRYLEWDYLSVGDPRYKQEIEQLKLMIKKQNDTAAMEWAINQRLAAEGILNLGGRQFRKVILTPLMMDFNNKGYSGNESIHYSTPPRKHIVEQVIDVFYGIQQYMASSPFKIFEIYPFLGINLENYSLGDIEEFSIQPETTCQPEKIRALIRSLPVKNKLLYLADLNRVLLINDLTPDETVLVKLYLDSTPAAFPERDCLLDALSLTPASSIERLLYKYFAEYNGLDPVANYMHFHRNFQHYFTHGNYRGDINTLGSFFFAGIKLYPPLNFNPWPDNTGGNLIKVQFIYDFCVQKNIPLTLHCQNSSFETIDNTLSCQYMDPANWQKILNSENYRKLKINFAHMGAKGDTLKSTRDLWTKKILELLADDKYGQLYTDFSCKGWKKIFYPSLEKILQESAAGEKLKEKILFGSDLMMNLLVNESYGEYIELFLNAPLSGADKLRYCHTNPIKFLFGEMPAEEES